MATSVTLRTFGYGDGLTYAANDLRLMLSAMGGSTGGPGNPLGVASGVRPGVGQPMAVAVASGLSVTVNTGYCIIQASSALNAGVYEAIIDSAATLTCTAADPTNPRIDSVCVMITDGGTSSSTAVVEIVPGTPASSPSAPSLPSNSLLLCNITVAANATTLTSGNLSDQRQYYVAAGGIRPVTSSSFYPTVGSGTQFLFDMTTMRLKWFNGTTTLAPKTAAFATVASTPGSVTANTTTYQTATSIAVTVDGSTSVEIAASFKSVPTGATTAGLACVISVFRGSTLLYTIIKTCYSTNPTLDGGGFTVFDPTPAAGTVTYSLEIANQGSGSFQINTGQIIVKAAAP